MWRAALFALTGALWSLSSVSFDPSHQGVSGDWTAVAFSTALVALAIALPLLADVIGGQLIFRASIYPAMGAALAGLSSFLSYGLNLGWVFWPYLLGAAVLVVGLAAFTVAVGVRGRDHLRLLAAVPAVTMLRLPPLHEPLVNALVLVAWLMASALTIVLYRIRPTRADSLQGPPTGRR